MSNPSLVIVDVGHGNCSVLRDNDRVAIVDCARRSSLLEYLEQEKISEINTIIISHADEDHLSGLIGLLGSEQFSIGQILINPDAAKGTRIWDDIKYALNTDYNAGKIDIETGVKAGPVNNWEGKKTSLEIVSPSVKLQLTGSGGKLGERAITTNTMSIVVRVFYEDNPIVILTGDIDQIALSDIVENKRDMNAKFLLYPHHGGNAGNVDLADFTRAILVAVSPDAILFSNGRAKFDNPQPAIVETAKEFGVKLIVCTQLSTRCSANQGEGGKEGISTSKFSAGAKHGLCCAGSMEIDLQAGTLVAARSQHVEFVKRLESPLCQ